MVRSLIILRLLKCSVLWHGGMFNLGQSWSPLVHFVIDDLNRITYRFLVCLFIRLYMDIIFGSLRQDLCCNDLYRIHQQIVRIRSVGVDWLLEEYCRMLLTSNNLTETWISLLLQGMLRLSSGSVQQCIVDLIDKNRTYQCKPGE
jgi:hypothetical protein